MNEVYDRNDVAILYLMVFIALFFIREFLSAELRIRNPAIARAIGIEEDMSPSIAQHATAEEASRYWEEVSGPAGNAEVPAVLADTDLQFSVLATRTL
ncbi:hypothetical protein [Candidatus Anaplasma sp. TIGMIC]|uniref:hypothetical protein n=1 Tax=Candidatus Anaplasma sp. TIGMIC TaxID=3020713 RepID=UPI00232DBBDA|nr:hypothetical protein [Candidatus Anaplasma sp. TIGMIC]MDB1135271.1 hypothetical protein [Candidatus Anaplasma sp. TIGMIC]